MALDGLPMDLEAPRERFDRRQEPLLQADDQQSGCRLHPARSVGMPLFPDGAVFVEEPRKYEFRSVFAQVVDHDPFDVAARKAALDLPDVFLQPPDHHLVQRALPADLHAPREPVRVQQFQQGREAVRMAVVRRRRQEEPMLETRGQVPDGPGELRFDPVAAARSGRRVMRLVQDQQAAGQQRAQPFAHRVRVVRVDQEVVRDQEAAVRAPRIHAEAALPAHAGQVLAVETGEEQAETLLEFRLPLLEHRGRRGDHDLLRLLAQEQLAGDQARFDRLPEPGVVGDEQVDPGQAERLAERLHLVGINLDAGPERGLEEIRVGGGHAAPPQGMQEGRERLGRIEALGCQVAPAFFREDAAVQFVIPEHVQGLALGVVVHAGKPHHGRVFRSAQVGDLFDQPPARAHVNQFADLWQALRRSWG